MLDQTQSDSFRCPICRETITIPNGGASSFPPAFIVNQLLDLIATQRRDVVPKCRIHANQELLFCETCDVVFCTECRGRSHTSQLTCGTNNSSPLMTAVTATSPTVLPFENGRGSALGDPGLAGPLSGISGSSSGTALNHNVISFNVAIKRCTEIMLYKMHLCVQELNNAQDAVKAELGRLETNQNICTEVSYVYRCDCLFFLISLNHVLHVLKYKSYNLRKSDYAQPISPPSFTFGSEILSFIDYEFD